MNLDALLDRLWQDYRVLNPQAERIHALLAARGEQVVNDHIAFRTFDHPSVNVEMLARPFLNNGYVPAGEYDFPDQHLRAIHLRHADATRPKIFISELRLAELPAGLHSLVLALLNQIPATFLVDPQWCAAGRPWKIARVEYEALARKSEYAAWLAAFGFRANHFTVFANALRTFGSLRELNAFIRAAGFPLNQDGGEVKGGAQVFLEQSSTMAAPARVSFSDGELVIPSCYYEFALRHRLPNGDLFQGFVAKNAARIFTSTDRRKP
jgi:hypothetical protein